MGKLVLSQGVVIARTPPSKKHRRFHRLNSARGQDKRDIYARTGKVNEIAFDHKRVERKDIRAACENLSF